MPAISAIKGDFGRCCARMHRGAEILTVWKCAIGNRLPVAHFYLLFFGVCGIIKILQMHKARVR